MSTTIDANAMNPADLAALNGTAAIAEPNALSPETTDLAAKLEDPEASKGFLRRNAGKIAATVGGVAAAAAALWRGKAAAKFVGEVGEVGEGAKVRAFTAKFFGVAKDRDAYVKASQRVGEATESTAEAVTPAAVNASDLMAKAYDNVAKAAQKAEEASINEVRAQTQSAVAEAAWKNNITGSAEEKAYYTAQKTLEEARSAKEEALKALDEARNAHTEAGRGAPPPPSMSEQLAAEDAPAAAVKAAPTKKRKPR